MIDFIADLGAWSWWILGAILLTAELLAPGVFLVWFGVAALIIGALSLMIDWSWQAQIISFGVLAIAIALTARQLLKKEADETGDAAALHRRGHRLVGRRFHLKEPIAEGRGKITVNDTTWRVTGPDLPVGTEIEVESVAGSVLTVKPVGGE